jgi:DNA polymerase-3 subunit epsilon
MRTACIDFETANTSDASICATGIAVFDDFTLTESLYWLVRPPKGHGFFLPGFTEIHGLRWFDVQAAPEFKDIAPEVLERLESADFVVAHSAPFDLRKLAGTLQHFNIPCPEFVCLCTLQLSRLVWPDLPSHGLGALADHIHHKFQHHNAQADAEAAGRVLMAMAKTENVNSAGDLYLKLRPRGAHLFHGLCVPDEDTQGLQHGLCVASRAPLTQARTREDVLHELEGEREDAGLLPTESQKLPSEEVLQFIRAAFADIAFANSVNF